MSIGAVGDSDLGDLGGNGGGGNGLMVRLLLDLFWDLTELLIWDAALTGTQVQSDLYSFKCCTKS